MKKNENWKQRIAICSSWILLLPVLLFSNIINTTQFTDGTYLLKMLSDDGKVSSKKVLIAK